MTTTPPNAWKFPMLYIYNLVCHVPVRQEADLSFSRTLSINGSITVGTLITVAESVSATVVILHQLRVPDKSNPGVKLSKSRKSV